MYRASRVIRISDNRFSHSRLFDGDILKTPENLEENVEVTNIPSSPRSSGGKKGRKRRSSFSRKKKSYSRDTRVISS